MAFALPAILALLPAALWASPAGPGRAGWAAGVLPVTQMLCDPGRQAALGCGFSRAEGSAERRCCRDFHHEGLLGTRAHCVPRGGWTLSHCLFWAGTVPSPLDSLSAWACPPPHPWVLVGSPLGTLPTGGPDGNWAPRGRVGWVFCSCVGTGGSWGPGTPGGRGEPAGSRATIMRGSVFLDGLWACAAPCAAPHPLPPLCAVLPRPGHSGMRSPPPPPSPRPWGSVLLACAPECPVLPAERTAHGDGLPAAGVAA